MITTPHGAVQTCHEDKSARLSAQHEQALTQLTQQHQQLMTHQLEQYEQASLERLAQHQAECNSLRAQAQEGCEQLVAQQAQHAAELDCLTKQQQGCTADLHLQLQIALQVRGASGKLYQHKSLWDCIVTFSLISCSASHNLKHGEWTEAHVASKLCEAVMCHVQFSFEYCNRNPTIMMQ